MNIRRFGPGHRRADRAAGSNGVLSSAIFSNDIAQITEFTVTPGGAYGPLRSAGDIVLVVIEGGGWVQVGDERTRIAAGEAVLFPAGVPHGAWTDTTEMRAILVEFGAGDDRVLTGYLAPGAASEPAPVERGEGSL